MDTMEMMEVDDALLEPQAEDDDALLKPEAEDDVLAARWPVLYEEDLIAARLAFLNEDAVLAARPAILNKDDDVPPPHPAILNKDDVPPPHPAILNDDVLYEIFKFLSTFDRKNAKLVCRTWFAVCRCKRYIHEPVISISHFYDFPLINQIIDASTEPRLHLRFTNRRFYQKTVEFWKVIGWRVESLQFFKCKFTYTGSLRQILSHCPMLRELSLIRCKRYENKEVFASKSKLKHHNLVVLHLDQNSDSFCITEKEMYFIPNAFPNLRSLKISLQSDSTCPANFSALVNSLITNLKRLERIHVNFTAVSNDFPLTVYTLKKLAPANRLKSVTLSGQLQLFTGSVRNANTFAALTHEFWSSLHLKQNWISHPILLDQILHKCSLLQELKFDLKLNTLENFSICWSALVRSRLRFLNIKIAQEVPINVEDFINHINLLWSINTWKKNTTLQHLHISTELPELYTLFAQYFEKIDDLFLETNVLKNYSVYPEELLSLCANIRNVSPPTFSLRVAINSLEFLELRTCLFDLFLMYRFPSLKYLNINFDLFGRQWKSKLSELKTILERDSPNLEGILFTSHFFGKLVFKSCFRFASTFQNLRYLSLSCTSLGQSSRRSEVLVDVKALCRDRPSLKAVSIRTKMFCLYYFYNPIAKTYELVKKYTNIANNETFPVDLKDLWRKERAGTAFI